MRVLICPDKFAGSIGAADAARAIASGWTAIAADDVLDIRPLADGGPGFIEVLAASSGGTLIPVATTDPIGRPTAGSVLTLGRTAYVESAQACGLHLLTQEERKPTITTSYGLGALVSAAIDAGALEIVIGLGGSATNDAGTGFLAALGLMPVDAGGGALPPGGAALGTCDRLIRSWISVPDPAVAAPAATAAAISPIPAGVRLVGATDVDSPLTGISGATAVYGPQKGASSEEILRLDAALARFVLVLERDLGAADLDSHPGAGAAGGLGAAILALGGELRSGIGLVRDLTGLDATLDAADLVITGEGSLDAQSLRGKVVAGVANSARDRGVPCLVLAGTSSVEQSAALAAGVTGVYTLVDHFGSVELAMSRPAEGLSALAGQLARQWSGLRRS